MTTPSPNSKPTVDNPRIYVACLAAYNNGKLHGEWIDAIQDPDEILAEVQAMLKASPEPDAEEYAIHDYDDFHGIRLSEYEGLTQAHKLAFFVQEHGLLGAEVYSYYGDLDTATEALTEQYSGCYTNIADYAEELTTDTMTIPDNLAYYIDYDKMARDMEMSGDILTIETAHDEVHVFWNH